MAMVRCEQGHYYDSGKNTSCPNCGVDIPDFPETVDVQRPAAPAANAGKTIRRSDPGAAAAPARPSPGPSDGKTIRVPAGGGGEQQRGAQDVIVGWLVCVEGPSRGRDYRIHHGQNLVGRADNMDIAIRGDESISREKHTIIVYDAKSREFLVRPGEGSGLTYVNDKRVDIPMVLNSHDKIELGSTILMFVPLCGENFSW